MFVLENREKVRQRERIDKLLFWNYGSNLTNILENKKFESGIFL